jgi:hypothetical protein
MLIQKIHFCLKIPISDFPEHPPHGFMDEILLVFQQGAGNLQSILKKPVSNIIKGGDDGDSPFPQIPGPGKIVQGRFVLIRKIASGNVMGRAVYQVPVVDVQGMGHINGVDLVFCLFIPGFEKPCQEKKGQQAGFVEGRLKQTPGVGKRNGLILFSQLSQDRNPDAQKHISFTVLPFSGFEKPFGVFRHTGVGQGFEFLLNVGKKAGHGVESLW